MRNRFSQSPIHFLPPVFLAAVAWLLSFYWPGTTFFTSLFNVLPTLLVLLGGAFCVVYQRQSQLFTLITLYIVHVSLSLQTEHFQATHTLRAETPLVFHLATILAPLLVGVYSVWSIKAHLLQDTISRVALLLVATVVPLALGRVYPDGMLHLVDTIYWPSLHGDWMKLAQLAYITSIVGWGTVVVRYALFPRPQHAAPIVAIACLAWMWSQVFIAPHVLDVVISCAQLMILGSVIHETFYMAFRDELTGIPGRRALNERLSRLGSQYVIAMADVDHFKKFNDTHGHDVGDQVLRLVASKMRKVGGGGSAFRYGGEEFTLLFPGKTLEQCLPHLEEVRRSIETYPLRIRDPQNRPKDDDQGKAHRGASEAKPVFITVSMGVAERGTAARTPEEVIKCADQALYKAKGAGRNNVMPYGQGAQLASRVKRA
ncbi:diguanylate cyclase (GGDEF)-like protein [Pseudomonas duriflava]|uniref:diguanylate cyclase n=1 Tax=Pseudomonas duriflava TaxID=459528 RepID=A0A562QPK1_9PSED|nr:GGDEF domain-containing protein [Pseudomonas duriflava]TWI58679.1 diguanylate cyclase (GGDEF)-like protein [Pseudomonas duriflava]